jgi:two-component sensor histidine kinase
MDNDDLFFASFDEARSPDIAEESAGDIREALSESALRQELERRQRTFDMAMTASHMGTWRYTLADNVCIYDANAQRLYGLAEARFLHDEEGVKAKFHADDMELMWERVAKALDPAGDGRYEVEYRVRQPDGSWRWLSAWGLVEFEGEGPERKAVAISGASRDLTERKEAEDFQRLLLDELNHRVKNTLATVHAVTAQTLRHASDLPSARQALEQRIMSMARAHDLLTARTWTGADLADVVARALEAFPPQQVKASGPPLDLPSRHVLALSLALHELATNASKYGALSCPQGRVEVRWSAPAGEVRIAWSETGGPPVAPPAKHGFGTRLLQQLVADLGGTMELNYDPAGLRCRLSASL